MTSPRPLVSALMTEPYTIAAIDAGSNAIRVQVAAVVAGELVPLESERVPVRLGRNAFTVGELSSETIDDAVAAFARFRKLFDYHKVQSYRAVATSATRSVRNRVHLLHAIQYETGIDVEVIDGAEEMRLVRVAVASAMREHAQPRLLVDLGGGSIELGAEIGGEWDSSSMPIGTVRMMESFGLQGSMSDADVQMLARYVQNLYRQFGVERFGALKEDEFVGTGGNAEALCKLFGREDEGVWRLSRRQLKQALKQLLPMDVDARVAAFGVREDRAEVIGIAGVIFLETMRFLDLEEMQSPVVGVREGILLELLEEHNAERPEVSRAAALVSALRVYMARLGHEPAHGEQVRRLALQLYDGLKDIHRLPDEARLALELSALVHDVGEIVERRSHHRHSEYLIVHGRIPGLEAPLRDMVASLSRAHRKSLPDPSKHQAFGRLKNDERRVVERLVPILRIADALDTDHRHQVQSVSVRQGKGGLVLEVHCDGESLISAESLSRRNELFEREYGIPLTTEVRS